MLRQQIDKLNGLLCVLSISLGVTVISAETTENSSSTSTTTGTTTQSTTSTTTRSTTAETPFALDLSQFAGEADDVFIFDRSGSIGSIEFDKTRNWLHDFLEYSFILAPNHNRLAIVTFGNDSSPVLDLISNGESNDARYCVVRQKRMFNEVVHFVDDLARQYTSDPFSIRRPLNQTIDIFKHGSMQRPNIPQRLWILSDIHELAHASDIPELTILKLRNVTVYGVGIGEYKNRTQFLGYVTSSIYYHPLEKWNEELDQYIQHIRVNDTQINNGTDEECDYQGNTPTNPTPTGASRSLPNMILKLWSALTGLAALGMIMIMIYSIIYIVNRHRNPTVNTKPPSTVIDLSPSGPSEPVRHSKFPTLQKLYQNSNIGRKPKRKPPIPEKPYVNTRIALQHAMTQDTGHDNPNHHDGDYEEPVPMSPEYEQPPTEYSNTPDVGNVQYEMKTRSPIYDGTYEDFESHENDVLPQNENNNADLERQQESDTYENVGNVRRTKKRPDSNIVESLRTLLRKIQRSRNTSNLDKL